MAKVTVHGGASNKYDPTAVAADVAAAFDQIPVEDAVELIREDLASGVDGALKMGAALESAEVPAEEGGEQSSPGTSTSTSSGKPPKSSGSSEPSRPRRARSAESP